VKEANEIRFGQTRSVSPGNPQEGYGSMQMIGEQHVIDDHVRRNALVGTLTPRESMYLERSPKPTALAFVFEDGKGVPAVSRTATP